MAGCFCLLICSNKSGLILDELDHWGPDKLYREELRSEEVLMAFC